VILRSPFPIEHAADLWHWLNTPREPNFEDGAAEDFETFRAELETRAANEKTFALHDAIAGKPIGFIGFARLGKDGLFRGVVIAPERRGQGLGAAFLRLVARTLRAQGFGRLSALFFADNIAIRETFRRAGAVEEGLLEGVAMRGGKATDMRLWSFIPAEGE
jgi:RimJ/RimL family protein N-acetyltransferase